MSVDRTEELTALLDAVNDGDRQALPRVLAIVYDELRRMAATHMQDERPAHTLQPTALVHEAYLKLMADVRVTWESRAHFFGAAAEAMRRILVDHARSRLALKRGGDRRQLPLDDQIAGADDPPDDILRVDEALKRLSALDERKGRIVQLRYFAGLSVEETAEVLAISERSVKRHWRFAKAWLYRELGKC